MMKNAIFMLLFLMGFTLLAQDSETLDDLFGSEYTTPLTIDLDTDNNEEEEDEYAKENDDAGKQRKKKKQNPKIYYGIKTKRGFARTGFGNSVVTETFFYLKDKDYVGPDDYDREFYWYDFKKKSLSRNVRIREGYAGVLHGHYVKKMGEQIIEEGYFYKGKKHGRWVRYNRHDILQEKEYYWKGRTKESMMAYYDFEKTKLKEVIPMHYGERQGEYNAYHANGRLAVVGEYKFNHRVGLWREYYPSGKIKREIRYPEDPFDFGTAPVIQKEWSETGHLIFDRKKFENRL